MSPFAQISPRTAAKTAGYSFLASVVIVTLVDDLLLANFVVPGDTDALARDIAANPRLFLCAVAGYLLVLDLDCIVGVALYVVLRPAGGRLALLTGLLRLLYAVILAGGVIALATRTINAHSYASVKLSGYVFFAAHIFTLGLAIIRSAHIPNVLGGLLVIASLTYAVFFMDLSLPAPLMVIIMLIMAVAEIALSLWLVVKSDSLPLQRAESDEA